MHVLRSKGPSPELRPSKLLISGAGAGARGASDALAPGSTVGGALALTWELGNLQVFILAGTGKDTFELVMGPSCFCQHDLVGIRGAQDAARSCWQSSATAVLH